MTAEQNVAFVGNVDGTVTIDGFTFRRDVGGVVEVFGVRHNNYKVGMQTAELDWYVPKRDNPLYIAAEKVLPVMAS